MEMRTLCQRCRDSYEAAGYRCKWTGNKMKSSCDLCGRPGVDYNINKRGGEKRGADKKVRNGRTSENLSERRGADRTVDSVL